MVQGADKTTLTGWRRTWHEIIFEADTPAGKLFDIILIVCILLSVGIVMLDSVKSINQEYAQALKIGEWFFTILFTFEYIMRFICIGRPLAYAGSFFGIVDLVSIVPTYLSLFIPGAHYMISVRSLRLLRIFRILKLPQFLAEAGILLQALKASLPKITVFLLAVATIVTIVGAFMYVIEGPENGFTSIPVAVYWAIVTLTTVGFGDITPKTPMGQLFAGMVMILGYGILAVPTGIVTVELSHAIKKPDEVGTQSCIHCAAEGHDWDAKFCKHCGTSLEG